MMTPVVSAVEQAAENHLVGLFEDANLCAIHAKRCVMGGGIAIAKLLDREGVG